MNSNQRNMCVNVIEQKQFCELSQAQSLFDFCAPEKMFDGTTESLFGGSRRYDYKRMFRQYFTVYLNFLNKKVNESTTVGNCALAIMDFLYRVSDCSTVPNFVLACVNLLRTFMGLDAQQFWLKYENFIFGAFLSCFAIQVYRDTKSVAQDLTIDKDHTSKARLFVDELKKVCSNITKVKDSAFTQKLCKFASIIICSEFCEKIGIDSTWFGFTDLFHARLKRNHKKREHIDIALEILDTTTYLMDKLLLFHETGSYHFLYIDDVDLAEYERTYEKLLHYSDKFSLLANQQMTLEDYMNECDKAIEQGCKFRDFFINDHFKCSILRNQQCNLERFKLRALDKMKVTEERENPLCFCFVGAPGIGKSAFGNKFLHSLYLNIIALGCGFKKFDPKTKYYYNEDDEFFSEFKAYHQIFIMDDVGQFKTKITEAKKGGALAKLISLVNPVPYITNQAALEDKGMIPFLCKFIILTTNSYDAGLSEVFKDEGGAYRRIIFIEMKVKPQYARPGETQLLGDMSENGYMNHELHNFWVRKYISVGTKSTHVYWSPSKKDWSNTEPVELDAMGFGELMKFIKNEIQAKHYKQDGLSKKSVEHFYQSELCIKCDMPDCLCGCKSVAQDNTSDERYHSERFLDKHELNNVVNNISTIYAMYIAFMVNFWYFIHIVISYSWSKWKPNFATRRVISYIPYLPDHINIPYIYYILPARLQAYVLCDGWQMVYREGVKKIYNSTPLVYAREQGILKHSGLIGTSLAILASVYAIYSAWSHKSEAQSGEVKPIPMEEVKPNPWVVKFQPVVKLSGPASTITRSQLIQLCKNNLARLLVGKAETNIFFITSNYALVPKHTYNKLRMNFPAECSIIYDSPSNISMNRTIYVDDTNFIDVGMIDLVILHHNSLLPMKDLTKFLLDAPASGKMKGVVISRDRDGILTEREVHGFVRDCAYYSTSTNDVFNHKVYAAATVTPTKGGDCCSPYVIEGQNGYFIAGVHIAGRPDGDFYRVECHMVLKSDVSFKNSRFNPLSREEVDLSTTFVVDKNKVSISQDVHPNNPIRGLSGNARVYGDLVNYPQRAMKTQVGRTLMAKDVLDHFKLDNFLHFSPKDVKKKIATKLSVEPMLNKPTFIQQDVYSCEDSLFKWYSREIKDIGVPFPTGPFDLDTAINGCDGIRYMERIRTDTSVGFPHGGPKSRYIVPLDPTPDHAIRNTFDDVIMTEYNNIKQCYLSGKRSNIVFDSNFKDEPLSLSKLERNKCRIFNSGPCAFTILFRQYYLWIIPYVSGKHRLRFGMAIGANVYSKDWKEIYEFVTKFGDDRIIAGDYSNFDKRMSAQLMTSAFNVLIRICEEAGWSEDDLLILRGLASDVCYPLTNIFGLLLETEGSNPSGHPLTTVINGMCNIMYMMLACKLLEFSVGIQKIDYAHFQKYFSIVTYGDDNIAGISSEIPYVNHTLIALALEKYDVIYTLADKSDNQRDFINIREADFLKRRFVKDFLFEGHVAAPISEDSIVKMLTTIVVSNSITIEEQCANVIETAAREYVLYGSEVYNNKLEWLNSVLLKYSLKPYLSKKLPTWDLVMLDLQENWLDNKINTI